LLQRRVLHLGELNTRSLSAGSARSKWSKKTEGGTRCGLFSDRHGRAESRGGTEDVAEVLLSSLVVRRPAAVWGVLGRVQVMGELDFGEFWQQALGEESVRLAWEKVVELLVATAHCAAQRTLHPHEKWFPQTACRRCWTVTSGWRKKDRLYRALDRIVGHKQALESILG